MSGPQSVVVPVEPTPKMMAATWDHEIDKSGGIESQNTRNARIWTAMLAAAPAPPSLAGGEVREAVARTEDRIGSRLMKAKDEAWNLVPQGQRAKWIEDNLASATVEVSYSDLRTILAALSPEAPARKGEVIAASDVPMWADGIVTDGENVAMAQKAETDHGGHYWAVDGGNGGLDWEPTHFISLDALTPRHEAPAELLSNPQELEATAEGAGDREAIARIIDPAAFLFAADELMKGDPSQFNALSKADRILALRARSSAPEARDPIPVTIFCPQCALPHVDEGEWATTRQHKTHQCQGCGHEWRPFPFATVGVTHPAAPSDDKLRIAVEALEPFARLELPKKPVGNAGAWSLLHSDIRRAKEALAALKAEG